MILLDHETQVTSKDQDINFCDCIKLEIITFKIKMFVYFLKISRPLHSSGEALTFQTEYPPPPGSNISVRPFGQGCNNLYCSEKLLQFLKATHVRLHFVNHTLVQNPEHRYYGLERILVTGR